MVSIKEMSKASLIQEISIAKSLTISKLEQMLGFSNGGLRKAIVRQSDLKNETIERIVETFPDLNEEYIRTGRGQLVSPKNEDAIPLAFIDETEVTMSKSGMEFRDLDNGMVLMTMTLVPETAYASYPHGWRDPEYLVELPKYSIVLPKREPGIFRAFEVRGDSMDDGTKYSISHGDVAIGKLVDFSLWDQKLYSNGGTDYVIVTHDGIIVKRIVDQDIQEGVITCASRNPNKTEFPNFTIRLTEVYELYRIRKIDRDWNYR